MSVDNGAPAFNHISCIPYDPDVYAYVNWGEYIPHTYTNWREETLSWKKSAYISPFLSCFPTLTITGPDALKLLETIAVNSFANFPVGSCKHMIICSEKGNVLDHGLVMCTAEGEYTTFITPFYLQYMAEKRKFDVDIKSSDFSGDGRNFVFQIAGPKSLEIVENLIEEDIHDLKFMRFKWYKAGDCDVRILRMGMGGSLSYEVQGYGDETALKVYKRIMEIGAKYDIKRLGMNQYHCNHTENGFPQTGIHFPGAMLDDPDYVEFRKKMDFYEDQTAITNGGNYGTKPEDMYRDPYELGWGHMVKFDHDFIGREALEKIAQDHREVCTLVWNHEDILKVIGSYFEQGEEPYMDITFPHDTAFMGAAENVYLQNQVLNDAGEVIGVSMWRTYTIYYREMISMGCVNPEYAKEGTEVKVLWGKTGERQIPIRATVARYPFLDLTPNRDFDMESIPHYKG